MKVKTTINTKKIRRKLETTARSLPTESRQQVEKFTTELYLESTEQVPIETTALLQSAYRTVTPVFGGYLGKVGYGGNGDPVNPKTGLRVSDYMLAVHENLEAYHAEGKAKFLEDPAREIRERYRRGAGGAITKLLRSIFNGG